MNGRRQPVRLLAFVHFICRQSDFCTQKSEGGHKALPYGSQGRRGRRSPYNRKREDPQALPYFVYTLNLTAVP